MKGNIEERPPRWPSTSSRTRRRSGAAAAKFGVSKSTVHKDISERLPLYDRGLYLQAREVLELNKAQRHIRGGIATQRKYRHL